MDQKNMYEIRQFRDKIENIMKPAFNSWKSMEYVKNELVDLLLQEYGVVVDSQDDDEHALFI